MTESNDDYARLKSERDAARGEAKDFRRAWAILREDENQRMPATAEEGARQFRAEFDAVRAELSEANASLIRARAAIVRLRAELEAAMPYLDTDHSQDEATCRACKRTAKARAALSETP